MSHNSDRNPPDLSVGRFKTFQDWWDENDLKSHDVIMRCAAKHLWDDAQKECGISKDAYDGAREDLLIWKKRALEAEALIAKYLARHGA